MLALINPFMIPLAAAAVGLDYLRRTLLPSAPSTSSVSAPYTPPFTGGQCTNVPYLLAFTRTGGSQNPPSGEPTYGDARTLYIVVNSNGVGATSYVSHEAARASSGFGGITAKINGIVSDNGANAAPNATRIIVIGTSSGNITFSARSNSGFVFNGESYVPYQYAFNGAITAGGSPDTCGDVPNPDPALPIPSDGIASAAPPDISDNPDLVLGSPLVAIPSLSAAIAAIVAAVNAAANALDAARLIMDALAAISNVLDEIKRWLEDKDKEDDTKKTLRKHDFGSIRKDGFLRLYPSGDGNGFDPQYIDLQMLSIPISYGKFFGSQSPNFYRFTSLGYISFVSPTFGIISTHEIEFSRVSLNVPDNAYGFFYHLGLDDTLRANVSMFYLQRQEGA